MSAAYSAVAMGLCPAATRSSGSCSCSGSRGSGERFRLQRDRARAQASACPSRSGLTMPRRPRRACIAFEQGFGSAGRSMPRSVRSGCGSASGSTAPPRMRSRPCCCRDESARVTASTARWPAGWPAASRRARARAEPRASTGAVKSSRSRAVCRSRGRSGTDQSQDDMVLISGVSPGARSIYGGLDELSVRGSRMRHVAPHGKHNCTTSPSRSDPAAKIWALIGARPARSTAARTADRSRILLGVLCPAPAVTITPRLARIRTDSRVARSEAVIPRSPRISASDPRLSKIERDRTAAPSIERACRAILAPRIPVGIAARARRR